LSISGPPRSSFTLFGGPGFILALLALLGLGIGVLYLATSDRHSGGASLSLPGTLGSTQPAKPAAKPESEHGDPPFLQSMQPMAPAGSAAPAIAPVEPRYPVITEDLSPIDLLVQYTPDPHLALDADAAPEAAEAADARRYRRPSAAAADAKRLALVVTGLGRDRALTAQAILAMPADVSLSFDSGSADLADWIDAARAYGHEALVDLELGTTDSLAAGAVDDSRLLAELGPAENLRRLEALLARAPKVAGVTIAITDAFLADAPALTPILARLQAGGWVAIGLPVTAPLTIAPDRVLTAPMGAAVLTNETRALKALARQRGAALALVDAANAIALADDWARPGSGIAEFSLVPASALVEK
jgi:polysaccharide deacetylase 2 family uncharacterized protein YibQ